MYANEFDKTITAACGCKIKLDVELESPPCRCGGGCWDEDCVFTYTDISITEPCATHTQLYPMA